MSVGTDTDAEPADDGNKDDRQWIACTDEATRASVSGFEVRRYGNSRIFELWQLAHGETAERRIGNAIWLRGMARDPEGLDWCAVIDFVDNDRAIKRWLMPREALAGDRVELFRQLLRRGYHGAGNREARNALYTYVSATPRERFTTVRSAGWHGKSFVMGARTIGPDNYLMVDPPTDATPSGTLASWREHVAQPAIGNSRLVFAISAGFASPLLSLADAESGGVHFVGGSSIGKSTAAHAARSVWGRELQTWRTTDNGLEASCARSSDMGLVLDEIGEADGRIIGACAYMVANGQGKARASRDGTDRPRQAWRLIALSTGEKSIAKHMADAGQRVRAGQEVRFANVEANAGAGFGLFENVHGRSPATFADTLVAAAGRHYGTAGPAFVEHLVTDRTGALEQVELARREFTARHGLNDADGQVQRVAQRFALVAAAGEFATGYGITGWEPGEAMVAAMTCFVSWRESWTPAGSREAAAALEAVIAFIQTQASRFEPRGDDTAQYPIRDRAGFVVPGESGEYLIYPKVFCEEVCRGLRAKHVADVLIARGFLVPDKDGKRQKRYRAGGKRQRFYAVRASILEGSDDVG